MDGKSKKYMNGSHFSAPKALIFGLIGLCVIGVIAGIICVLMRNSSATFDISREKCNGGYLAALRQP